MAVGTKTIESEPVSIQNSKQMSKTKVFPILGLVIMILVGGFLRFYQLGAYSIGNTYYAAAVKSMLQSWHNFFFVAFEPGGSVTVDKPPLGFWIQAVSAYFFGINGFALAFPQALAGTLSIPLLYHLVKRHFGVWAGLTAALVLALMPVTIATERNNTIDGTLVFVLLLAAWAFILAAEKGQLRYLLLGAVLVGLGFNIKMLQAFMPLPAFYAVYFLGAKLPWWKRILNLGIASVVLLVVSLAWVVAVDLTPADQRPYIGSSQDNTVLELIIGHNGLNRLGLNSLRDLEKGPTHDGAASQLDGRPNAPDGRNLQPPQGGADNPVLGGVAPQQGSRQPGNIPTPPVEAVEACDGLGLGDSCTVELPNRDVDGVCIQHPADEIVCTPEDRLPVGTGQIQPQNNLNLQGNGLPPGGPAGDGGQGGRRSSETGTAGVLRLLEEPLVTEASWLMPLILLGIPVAFVALGWSWPLSRRHLGLLLWVGWLLPMMAYFSFTTGLFHRYYLIMLGPAVGALAGITLWAVIQQFKRNHWVGWVLTLFLTGFTAIFQVYVFRSYPDYAGIVTVIAVLGCLLGLGFLAAKSSRMMQIAGAALVLVGLLAPPLFWSGLTTLNENPNVALPTAGVSEADQTRATFMTPNEGLLGRDGEIILDYLLDNTDSDGYLLATNNARGAAPYILETGRPVFTFGGFSGGDNVIDLDGFIEKVSSGELQYVLGIPQKQEIARWITNTCTVVDLPGINNQPSRLNQNNPQSGPGDQQNNVLFDCGI